MMLFVSLSCALAVEWLQPPDPQPPALPPVETPRPVVTEPRRVERGAMRPSTPGRPQAPGGNMPAMRGIDGGPGNSQFATGVFPLGATYASADAGGLAVETLATEMAPKTATRQVPVRGPDGQTQHRAEQYTMMVPVFKVVKRSLPPNAKVYRNGRELSAEEKNNLRERTPIFIATMGASNAAPPGRGFEQVIGDHLVAFIPATGTAMPPGPPGMAPAPGMMAPPAPGLTPTRTPRPVQPTAVPSAVAPRSPATPSQQTGRVARVDAQAGVVFITVENQVAVPTTRTGMKKETRTGTERDEQGQPRQRQVEVEVPFTYTQMTTRNVTFEAKWSAESGRAYEPSGEPITPATAALGRLQPGDPVVWMQGPPGPNAFARPLPNPVKMVLAAFAPTAGRFAAPAVDAPTFAPPAAPAPAAPIPSAPGSTPAAPTPDTGGASADETAVVEQANEARAALGLPPLQVDATLTQAARQHSANMARQGRLEHFLGGKGPRERLVDLGAAPLATGENCALGQRSGAEAIQGWLSSPGHRANILNPAYTHVGVGKADGPGGPYWTQVLARLDR